MTTDTIRQILSHPDGYRRDAWRDFLKALFPTAEIFAAPQPVTHPGEELPDGFQLGRAMLADGRRIAFIEQPVPASTNLMRNRVGLRNRIARLIDQESATGVLAIFTDAKDRNFRLSFVARESSLTFTDEGTQTTKTETAPKRFTYYLGPDEACTTAAQRFELLLKLGAAAKLPDLIDAFSVEKLNTDFFNDFSRRVSEIAAELETTHSDWTRDTCRTEAQTLLNRLVFLYFVQRKGWLNRSRTFLKDAFKPHADQPGCTFFRSFLGPLFECLSTEPGLAPAFPHDVPFLNGGLFSDEAGADDPDIQRRRSLDVSNAVFRTVFQELLDRYNFTIVEDSPSSVEVAIDPEMLGHVFEALVLQREESDTGGKSRRHDTGSHYTPRPIVHYICREALAGWLENQPPFSGQPDARLRIDGLLPLMPPKVSMTKAIGNSKNSSPPRKPLPSPVACSPCACAIPPSAPGPSPSASSMKCSMSSASARPAAAARIPPRAIPPGFTKPKNKSSSRSSTASISRSPPSSFASSASGSPSRSIMS